MFRASENPGPEIRDTMSRIEGQVLVGPERAIHLTWIALFVCLHQGLMGSSADLAGVPQIGEERLLGREARQEAERQ